MADAAARSASTSVPLKKIDVPMFIMHGDDDQTVPIGIIGLVSSKTFNNATLKGYRDHRTA